MPISLDRPLLLRGNIVWEDGRASRRYVLVKDGWIRSVTRHRPPAPADVLCVEASHDDWIFPGLLDLHTHAAYNVLPLWEPGRVFGNRFDWRGDASYRRDVRGVFRALKPRGRTLDVFAELQAVAGGTTLLQESTPLDDKTVFAGSPVLCRGTGSSTDLGLPMGQSLASVVDFFRRKSGKPYPVRSALEAYVNDRRHGKRAATLVHLAEGRSGFWRHQEGVDRYTRLEFEAFMNHKAFADADAVRSSPLNLVHGCGIDPDDPAHLRFLLDRGIGLVWSPASNMLLYEDTLDVERFLAAGVDCALGSDWSPSGSKHVWDEAKLARFLVAATGANVSDEQIFRMVTTSAAHCLRRADLGRIAPGCVADFFILRSPLESDNPLEVFFGTRDEHVRAVIVGGRPIYGDRELLGKFPLPLQQLPTIEGEAVRSKVAHLPADLDVDLDRDVGDLEAQLKAKKVQRSNLLVDTDGPYRQRMRRLRGMILERGEKLQRYVIGRRRSPRPQVLAVAPDAVRVWRGVRLPELSQDHFLKKLQDIFIPGTASFQRALGLTAYLPVVPPADHPVGTPDEIALVFYESQRVYRDTFATLIGRAYGDLHATVFDLPASSSGFPSKLTATVKSGQPVHLFDHAVDWQRGTARAFVATRPPKLSATAYRKTVRDIMHSVADAPSDGLDGAIFVADPNCFIYWEHWSDGAEVSDAHLDALRGVLREAYVVDATPTVLVERGLDVRLPAPLEEPAGFNFQFKRRYHGAMAV